MNSSKLPLTRNDTNILQPADDLKICPEAEKCKSKDFVHFTQFQHPLNSTPNDERAYGNAILELELKPILNKCYSEMTDEEKRLLISKAKQIVSGAHKAENVIREKSSRAEELYSELETKTQTSAETETNNCDQFQTQSLYPKSTGDPYCTEADLHFRVAESQFYRLIYGSEDRLTRSATEHFLVTRVDRVVNPELQRRFESFRHSVQLARGSEYCRSRLAFHGTTEANIDSICRFGFRDPKHPEYEQSSDSGYYGRGIYFSQHPTYAMDYIKDHSSLLLCHILLGRVLICSSLLHGQSLQPGYHSHSSPSGREIILFDSSQALPAYRVHFRSVSLIVSAQSIEASVSRFDSKFEPIVHINRKRKNSNTAPKNEAGTKEGCCKAAVAKMLKLDASNSVLDGTKIMLDCSEIDPEDQIKLEVLISEFGGRIDPVHFSVLVTTKVDIQRGSELSRLARERNVPCASLDFLLQCLVNHESIFNEKIAQALL